MVEPTPSQEDLLKRLEAIQPPIVPNEVFTEKNLDVVACRSWHKNTAAAFIGGLQTDPQFHANGIRLDWLIRLVLSKANGRRKPTRYDLSRVLNVGLENAGVARLEDPNGGPLLRTNRVGARKLPRLLGSVGIGRCLHADLAGCFRISAGSRSEVADLGVGLLSPPPQR
jgi:hypothetical protein